MTGTKPVDIEHDEVEIVEKGEDGKTPEVLPLLTDAPIPQQQEEDLSKHPIYGNAPRVRSMATSIL